MTRESLRRRAPENPILTAAMVVPSRPDYEVVGVFNPGVAHVGGETLLLLRVAEAPRGIPEDEIAAPIYDAGSDTVVIRTWKRDAPGVDVSDRRVVTVGGAPGNPFSRPKPITSATASSATSSSRAA